MRETNRIENDIRSVLDFDPRLPHPHDIAISVDGIGTVTPRGTVGSLRQQVAAVRDAPRRICDLDHLKIGLRETDRHSNDGLRGRALQLLMWDAEIPSDRIDVKVSRGWVTLTGKVDS